MKTPQLQVSRPWDRQCGSSPSLPPAPPLGQGRCFVLLLQLEPWHHSAWKAPALLGRYSVICADTSSPQQL